MSETSAENSDNSQLSTTERKFSQNPVQSRGNGRRYNKKDRSLRQQEVYRLYFEQGMSSRKIANHMKINRKTIDSDVDYWYSILIKKWQNIDIKNHIVKQIQMMDSQRERLLEEREKNPEQILFMEKLIFEINEKIANLLIKIESKDIAVKEEANKLVCDWAQKQGLDFRAIDPWRLANIPASKYNQIVKILDSEVE